MTSQEVYEVEAQKDQKEEDVSQLGSFMQLPINFLNDKKKKKLTSSITQIFCRSSLIAMANPLHDYNTDELRFSHLFGFLLYVEGDFCFCVKVFGLLYRLEAQIVDIKC